AVRATGLRPARVWLGRIGSAEVAPGDSSRPDALHDFCCARVGGDGDSVPRREGSAWQVNHREGRGTRDVERDRGRPLEHSYPSPLLPRPSSRPSLFPFYRRAPTGAPFPSTRFPTALIFVSRPASIPPVSAQ